MIPTPASHLMNAPRRTVRRADVRSLERRGHTRRIAAIEGADGRHLDFETNTGGRVNNWRGPADRAAA